MTAAAFERVRISKLVGGSSGAGGGALETERTRTPSKAKARMRGMADLRPRRLATDTRERLYARSSTTRGLDRAREAAHSGFHETHVLSDGAGPGERRCGRAVGQLQRLP